jgi:hypothetical protein
LRMTVVIDEACGNPWERQCCRIPWADEGARLSRVRFCLGMVYGWGRLLFNVPNVEKLLVRSGGDIALEFARHAVQR